MRRTVRTSRCSSASSARPISTRSMPPPDKVLAAANVNAMKLEAFKYYYAPAGATGRRGHLREADAGDSQAAGGHHCRREAVHRRKPAPSARSPLRTTIPPPTRPSSHYVSTFVPKMSGENFNPHVSTGVAPTDYLDKMLAEPFASVHLLARGRGRLPARPVRHGGEETQGMGFEIASGARLQLSLRRPAATRKSCRKSERTPNHALQRTAPCVTAPASTAAFPPTMQVPRRTPRSLSLGSLGDSARVSRNEH